MFSVVLSLTIVIVIAFLLAVYQDSTVSKQIVPSMLLIMAILYFAALLDWLSAAKWILFVLIFGLIALCFWGKKPLLGHHLDYNVIFWVILVAIVCYVNYGRQFANTDEFSHWGSSLKQMYFTDRLYATESSILIYKRYPPMITILEYFFSMYGNQFNEYTAYIAYYTFIYSILFSAIVHLKTEIGFFPRTLFCLFWLLYTVLWGGIRYTEQSYQIRAWLI